MIATVVNNDPATWPEAFIWATFIVAAVVLVLGWKWLDR